LTAGSHSAWDNTSAIWSARLTNEERAALAWAALKALEPWQAEEVARSVLGDNGPPLPPFLDALGDAQWWADTASPAELRAYAFAAYQRLPRLQQLDFLIWAKDEVAA
jgi:hypothetical protein